MEDTCRTMITQINGILINIVKKRVKRLRLSVRADNTVTLTIPYGVSTEEGLAFTKEHIGWLEKKLNERRSDDFAIPKKSGDTALLFGRPYTLRTETAKRTKAVVNGNEIIVFLPSFKPDILDAALNSLYKRELFSYAERRLAEYAKAYGFTCNGLKIRKMTSRWGSCNFNTCVITLNLLLATKSERLVDHVIMHELIHTVVHDHGKGFYDLFDKLMPDHRARRNELNGKTK